MNLVNIIWILGVYFFIAGILGMSLIDNYLKLIIVILYYFIGFSLILIGIIMNKQEEHKR